MKIDLGILDGKTPTDKLQAWITYRTGGESFDLLIAMWTATEQRAKAAEIVASAESVDEKKPPSWLHKVKDWRGIFDRDNKPVPFTVERLTRLYEVDPFFSGWLARECQQFGHFRLAGPNDAAGPSCDPSASAGAGEAVAA